MLLFHPDLVDLGKTDDPLYEGLPAELPNYDVLPIVPGYTPPSGCLSSPVESSREKGAILAQRRREAHGGSRETRVLGRG